MNRPTRIAFIGWIVALIAVSWTSAAQPQENAAARVRKQFDDCFYAAVGQQWKTNFNMDPNIASENAFLACATEEQAMYAVLGLAGISPQQAQATVVGVKIKLKRAIREVSADPPARQKQK